MFLFGITKLVSKLGNCSYVCPHACIRPVILTKEELDNAPEGIRYQNAMQLDGYYYAMAISVYDCTGCGSCANVCPVNNAGKKAPALVMTSFDDETAKEQEKYDYLVQLAEKQEVLDKFKISTVKGSQFLRPYLEFSGACAGCGETPYAKLITQICGDRMLHCQCNRLFINLGWFISINSIYSK